jgi:CelD/BcsL family acetyltransferase involved in cellulose biosynthesis
MADQPRSWGGALGFGRFRKWRLATGDATITVARVPLSVKTLKAADEIRGQRALWNWPGTRDSDLDYFLYFASEGTEKIRPQVFVAYRGDTPEAILIGKLEHRQIVIRMGNLNVRTPRLGVLTFVYGGLRGSTGRETTEALVEEALKAVRCGEADVAVFECVAVNSQLHNTLLAVPRRFERGFHCEQHNQYRMQLPRSSQQLQQIIPAKQRSNYLRRGRKLVRDFCGEVSYQWYRQTSHEMYRDLEFVAERSYQRGKGVGFEDTPELRRWWEFAGTKGWLRVCILYAGGKPCAFFTGMAHSGILWGDYMAYDHQFAPYSPGMYLLLRSFGELCDCPKEHGIQEINLGPGDSELKSLLSSSCRQESSIYLYAPTLRGVGLNAILSLLFLADGSARKFLARGGLLARVVKRLRREHANRNLPIDRGDSAAAKNSDPL